MSFDPLNDKYLGFPSDEQWKAGIDRLHRTEAGMVRFIGDLIGYGRTMQLCEQIWREKDPSGSGHTVGPCAMFVVPCPHTGYANGVACEWCCGSGRVTKRVLQAMGSDATVRVIDDTAQQNCADPATDDLTVPLAVDLAAAKTEILTLKATIPQMREALESARTDFVTAIAFIGRDSTTSRWPGTGISLVKMLAEADAAVRTALSLAPAPAKENVARGVNGCLKVAAKALRYLAAHERPSGGEQNYNAAHLYQLADELDRTATPTRSAEMSAEAWQPIETAPKDGTKIIVCREGASDSVGIAAHTSTKNWKLWPWRDGSSNGRITHYQPTHWRALPTTAVSEESNG